MIPYGRQKIDEEDIQAVVDVLRSEWLTTGPKVDEFENDVANYVGTQYAVAVSSGTSALHTAMYALDIGPTDEVIVPSISFAATANCIVYQGGVPVFADVLPENLLIDPACIEQKITNKTKAVIAVDYAGHPCDYDRLKKICDRYNLAFIADSCHALGAEYKGRKIGSLADMTVFSFHPVKHITTGEGGIITCNNKEYYNRMKLFRNHGISADARMREKTGTWFYEMVDLGYNYRISDIQCALGISQLKKLPEFLKRRREIAESYDKSFSDSAVIHPLKVQPNVGHAYHLYVISIDFDQIGISRQDVFKSLRERGIGVNVHYIPIHLHPFYKKTYQTFEGECPVAEYSYQKILSLPIYPGLNSSDVHDIIESLEKMIDVF